MKRYTVKEVEKGMGDILVIVDDFDVVIQDKKHPDNAICLTRKEWKKVLKIFNRLGM